MGEPKYWRTSWAPMPYQFVGLEMNYGGEGSMGKPNYWLQSKRIQAFGQRQFFWLGSLELSSKQTLTI
jgi:hypothetical protein